MQRSEKQKETAGSTGRDVVEFRHEDIKANMYSKHDDILEYSKWLVCVILLTFTVVIYQEQLLLTS